MSLSSTAPRAAGASIAGRPMLSLPVTPACRAPDDGSTVEMTAPWTAQNAAHRALEISWQTPRFPHSHSRFLFV